MDDWSFDVFHINEIGDGHALKYVGYELLQKYNLVNKFKVCLHAIVSRRDIVLIIIICLTTVFYLKNSLRLPTFVLAITIPVYALRYPLHFASETAMNNNNNNNNNNNILAGIYLPRIKTTTITKVIIMITACMTM